MRTAHAASSALAAATVAAGLAVACASPAKPPPPPTTTAPAATTAHLRFLATSDEHGWLFPLKDKTAGVRRGGVLEAAETFRSRGLGTDDDVVLLSTGDMWTGPYESTLLQGAPMAEAMAKMGYGAAVVGNHDFDFGQDVLTTRAQASGFPFLSANVVSASTGAPTSFARPFTVLTAGGVKVGIVGLTTNDAPVTTDPKNLGGLRFLPHDEALKVAVPAARAAGAQIVVVIMHDGPESARAPTGTLRALGVGVVFYGHVHKSSSFIDDAGTETRADDIVFCNAGPYLRSYCEIDVQLKADRLDAYDLSIRPIARPIDAPVPDDPTLASILARASAAADREGGEVLVQSDRDLDRKGAELGQLVVRSWLKSFPEAQAAVTNKGGLRQDLPAGPVRVRDVVSVMPFGNTLVVVELSQQQLAEVLAMEETIATGIAPGAVPAGATVKVVTSDFLYRGGDHYRFQTYDAEPEETGIDWREPVLKALRAQGAAGKKLALP